MKFEVQIILWCVIGLTLICASVIVTYFVWQSCLSSAKIGSLGEFLTLANTLVAGFAFIAFLVAILYQKRDLALSTKEYNLNRLTGTLYQELEWFHNRVENFHRKDKDSNYRGISELENLEEELETVLNGSFQGSNKTRVLGRPDQTIGVVRAANNVLWVADECIKGMLPGSTPDEKLFLARVAQAKMIHPIKRIAEMSIGISMQLKDYAKTNADWQLKIDEFVKECEKYIELLKTIETHAGTGFIAGSVQAGSSVKGTIQGKVENS